MGEIFSLFSCGYTRLFCILFRALHLSLFQPLPKDNQFASTQKQCTFVRDCSLPCAQWGGEGVGGWKEDSE